MNDFERQYYESETFWNDTLNDPLSQLRIKETVSFIPNDVSNLVDIGCGNGVFLNYLANERKEIKSLGVDRSETALKYLKVEKLLGSIEKIPLDDNSFDCVTCLEVIEHIPFNNYKLALSELARVAKKYLIVSVPFNENLEENRNQCPECKSIFNIELHFRSFDKAKMNNLFLDFGFQQIKTITFGKQKFLKGHKAYSNLMYPDNYKRFTVPICPVCGYSNTGTSPLASTNLSPINSKKKFVSQLTKIPKLFWPMESRDYWIMTLYKKA